MRQRARGRVAAVVLVLWGLAAGVGASACQGEVSVRETAEPSPTTGEFESPGRASTNDNGLLGVENGQTGSLAPASCSGDYECVPMLGSWMGGDEEYALIDSVCEHGSSGEVIPECVCDVSVTRTVRDPSTGEHSRQTIETLYSLDNDERLKRSFGPQCLLRGDVTGACAYCDHEFPGCDVDASVNTCAAPCSDVVERLRATEQLAHDVELRVARCTDTGQCQVVVRIDEHCYNGRGVQVSCSLSDEEIIAAEGEPPNAGQQCARPPVPCASAEDCPAGLGCNGSVCGGCLGPEDACDYGEDGRCQNEDFACGNGERCIARFCVSDEHADCASSADCPTTDPEHDPRACLLSGTDNLAGRGNEQTRSFCSSAMPNPFGLRIGDVLEVRVLGSDAAVASMFDPPFSFSRPSSLGTCGEGTGLAEDAVLRLRIDAVYGTDTDYWPEGTLIDGDAPIDPVPAPVHPRDPAQGRHLGSQPYSESNYAALAFLPRGEPTTLRGCPGTRDMRLDSLLDRVEPGQPPRPDGTFPTTVLEHRFSVSDESIDDPACVAFTNFGCAEGLHVEVTRLTP